MLHPIQTGLFFFKVCQRFLNSLAKRECIRCTTVERVQRCIMSNFKVFIVR